MNVLKKFSNDDQNEGPWSLALSSSSSAYIIQQSKYVTGSFPFEALNIIDS